ncbi:hypothetical protein TRIUR3_24513 [Triticum urartu]|uniref:Uncharacterized protein n=1 Tax=Triticum urartu TaxID=4572 RepID=M8AUT4_TRIUA|nr:hypothetical protein TRIUR3_24513 [Triticum urartu]
MPGTTQFLCLVVALLVMSASLSCNAKHTYRESMWESKRQVHDFGGHNCQNTCVRKSTDTDIYCEYMWECNKPVHDHDQRKCRNFCVSKGYDYLGSYCEHHPYPYCCCHK